MLPSASLLKHNLSSSSSEFLLCPRSERCLRTRSSCLTCLRPKVYKNILRETKSCGDATASLCFIIYCKFTTCNTALTRTDATTSHVVSRLADKKMMNRFQSCQWSSIPGSHCRLLDNLIKTKIMPKNTLRKDYLEIIILILFLLIMLKKDIILSILQVGKNLLFLKAGKNSLRKVGRGFYGSPSAVVRCRLLAAVAQKDRVRALHCVPSLFRTQKKRM